MTTNTTMTITLKFEKETFRIFSNSLINFLMKVRNSNHEIEVLEDLKTMNMDARTIKGDYVCMNANSKLINVLEAISKIYNIDEVNFNSEDLTKEFLNKGNEFLLKFINALSGVKKRAIVKTVITDIDISWYQYDLGYVEMLYDGYEWYYDSELCRLWVNEEYKASAVRNQMIRAAMFHSNGMKHKRLKDTRMVILG